jgi:ribosomal protein S18 acetylase RimI-like enzyme
VTVVVRRARADDAPVLSAIARAAKARWGYPPEWLAAWDEDLTLTAADIARMTVYVADGSEGTEPTAVGVAALDRRGDDWSLEHLWVTPGAEGRGIGRTLFARVMRDVRMRGGSTITIVSDPNAVGFYERMGARVQDVVPAPMPGAPARTLPRLTLHLDHDAVSRELGANPE